MTPRQEPSKSTIGIARRLRVTYLNAIFVVSHDEFKLASSRIVCIQDTRWQHPWRQEVKRSIWLTMDSQSSKRLVEAGIAVAVLHGIHMQVQRQVSEVPDAAKAPRYSLTALVPVLHTHDSLALLPSPLFHELSSPSTCE